MKWFKHMADASDDEFLAELEEIFGWEGYGRWWKLLEKIALQMDKSGKCSASYSWSDWQRFLKGKRNKLETFLVHCQNKRKINLKQTGNILEIECCKLLEFRDEYSRKSRQTPDTTPDKVAPDIRSKTKEVEVEEEKKESKARGTRLALAELPEPWKAFCLKTRPDLNPQTLFEEFCDYWKAVPGRAGLKLDWEATWRNRVRDKHGQKATLFTQQRSPNHRAGAKTL